MPTAAERNALIFLSAVALIGGGMRLASAAQFSREVAGAETLADGSAPRVGGVGQTLGDLALEAQIAAIDSARALKSATRSSRGRTSRAPRQSSTTSESSSEPELPKPSKRGAATRPPVVVDINRASATELEQLPRVGPALAKRIVAWREANGPFRSMEDLRHVRGIGPATATLLTPSVTF